MKSLGSLREDILAARDRRQEMLDRLFPSLSPATVMLSLNLPGAEKGGARAERLFAWGERALLATIPGTLLWRGSDALGPFALFGVPLAAAEAKVAAIALEGGHPAGRLLDLDIYDPDGRQVDRAFLGLPPRSCLLCPEPALACIRGRRHTGADLQARVEMVIDAL